MGYQNKKIYMGVKVSKIHAFSPVVEKQNTPTSPGW
jgi:hypothetical protein